MSSIDLQHAGADVEDPALPVVGFPTEGPELEEENKLVLNKITRHVIPLVWALTFLSYMSRISLSNMHVVLSRELGLSEEQYGGALGAFYLAYVVFPMPSNLILERMRMNVWIALLVFAWGCITTLSIFIFNAASLVVFRFCLGLVEAGISPGIIYYVTMWFGEKYRVRQLTYIQTAGPFAYACNGLLANLVLKHINGALGITGWQWLYVITGIPAIFLSLFFYFYLPNSPSEAHFLTPRDQKILLLSRSIAANVWSNSTRTSHSLFWSTVSNSKNWLFAFCGMFTIACITGINGFAPAIIYESGSDLFTSNLLITIPHLIAILVMLGWSYHSVYYGERFWHAFSALFLALLALGGCTVFVYLWDLNFVVALLAVYQSLVVSGYSIFIAEMANSVLGSTSIGIGLYYAVLGFGGWIGPFILGYARSTTGDHVVSLALMCASLGIAISLFSIIHVTQRTTKIEHGSQMQLRYDSAASQSEGAKYEPKIETAGGAAILV